MKRLVQWSLFLFLIACACPVYALAEWTVIAYFVAEEGDKQSTLEDAQIRNINQMATPGSSDQVNLLVQMDRGQGLSALMKETYADPNYSGAKRYRLAGGKWNALEKLGEVNMGSPYALWECLKWAAEKYPAKRYALFINSHGSGVFSWRGTGATGSTSPGAVEFNPDRFVAYDTADNDCLTVFEVAAVLRAFRKKLNAGRPMSLIGFDACYSGCIEALYQFRDSTEVMMASPSETAMTGFPYGSIARALHAVPALDPEKLAEMATEAYIKNTNSSNAQVMGAWRATKAGRLANAIGQLAFEIDQAMQQTGKKFGVQSIVACGDKERYWDIRRVAQSIKTGNASFNGATNLTTIQQLAGDVENAVNDARISVWYDGRFAEGKVGGLSIAWPGAAEYQQWRAFYKALEFSADTHWDEMLDRREL
ncbi:MAG TPA: clostripain-related cysteine peptidase [Candidatus Ozemobacteraceae bacterium]|nr:clostripain-related cysteine peptidase [Candidatus Ozemobacteraceae bacterium]